MPTVKVDLEVGPAMEIEFIMIEGTKAMKAITPIGSKWKLSMPVLDVDPKNKIKIDIVATGIPDNKCTLEVLVDEKKAKLKDPEKKFKSNGFLYYDEEAEF